MAFALVRASTIYSGTGTLNLNLVGAVQGNLVTCIAWISSQSETLTGASDDKGNSYGTIGPIDSSSDIRGYVIYGVQTTGGAATLTLTFSGGATHRARCDEFSGGAADNTAIFDAYSTFTAAGNVTSGATGTLTTAATGELIWAGLGFSIGRRLTAGSGFTGYDVTGSQPVNSQYKLSGGASETAPFTLSNSTHAVEIAVAFKPASGGAAVNAGFFLLM